MNVLKYEERPDHLTITIPYGVIEGVTLSPPMGRQDLDKIQDDVFTRLFPNIGVSPLTFRMRKPAKFYHYALADDEAGVYVAYGIERQKWMVQLHGRWWQRNPFGNPDLDLMNTQGVKATRFDYCTTVQVDEKAVSHSRDLYNWALYLQTLTGRTTPRWHYPHSEVGEETYYAGSRRSRQFLRVYDKAYWPDSERDTLRIECEYKQDLATPIYTAWRAGDTGLSAASMAFGWYKEQDNWPALLHACRDMVGCPSPIPPVPRYESSYSAWFNGDVRSAFVSWAEEDPVAARVWLQNAFQRWTDLWTIDAKEIEHLLDPM